jgi:hypothetical protein
MLLSDGFVANQTARMFKSGTGKPLVSDQLPEIVAKSTISIQMGKVEAKREAMPRGRHRLDLQLNA